MRQIRHVARNFDRGVNNNEVSTFKYIMPFVFEASSTKGAFFWRFYSEYLCSNLQREVNLHWKTSFSWKPPFAYKTLMQDRWWKSRWFKSKICSMFFADYIAVEQEVIVTVIMIAFSIFTRFWCTPTHIQSKPSSNFALGHGLPKLDYKTCAHKRYGSYPIFERLIDVCSW